MPRSENREMLDQFASRICTEFGLESGRAIMRALFEDLGGFRITVPTLDDLEREARDQRIKILFNGANIGALSERFGLSPRQVRRIVNEG